MTLRLVVNNGKVTGNSEDARRSYGDRPRVVSPERQTIFTKLAAIKDRLKELERLLEEVRRM